MQYPTLKHCLESPGLCFENPKEIVEASVFSLEEKRQILQQWELDVRERLLAEEENMPEAAQDDDLGALLSDIHKALNFIDQQ